MLSQAEITKTGITDENLCEAESIGSVCQLPCGSYSTAVQCIVCKKKKKSIVLIVALITRWTVAASSPLLGYKTWC